MLDCWSNQKEDKEMQTKQYDEIKKSPLYNLSMCSLENFHSSFINWLGINYPQETLNLFLPNLSAKNIKFKTQERYKDKFVFDIYATYGENEILVIENKLKSYPTEKQLSNYSENLKNENVCFVLLTLAPMQNLPDKWKSLSYAELAKRIRWSFDNVMIDNEYHRYLINDYLNVIEHFSRIFPQNSSQKYDLYESNLCDLQDVYIKYRTNELKNYILTNSEIDDLVIDTDFRNKQGIISIWIAFKDYDITFLIQIQKYEYRYCMIYGYPDENNLRETLATELANNNLWFYGCIIDYPKAKNYNSKKFCGYKPNLIYRYQTLDNLFNKKAVSEVTYQEITERVKKDITNIQDNKYKIINILTKCI